MQYRTSDLSGALLNAAVAKAEGLPVHPGRGQFITADPIGTRYSGEVNFLAWTDGGPIVERERIFVAPLGDDGWWAGYENWCSSCQSTGEPMFSGPTPLVAAMRAYVASKYGETVELP